MKFSNRIILFAAIAIFSCKPKQETVKGSTAAFPPDQTLNIQFYPYWGGSAEALLERKNGKDKLYSTYHEKVNGIDTVLTTITLPEKSIVDSIFATAEKVRWNDDANYGTASGHEGLKVSVSFRKGRTEKTVLWDKLKNASELPLDLIPLVQLVNDISPNDFKLF